MQYAIVPRKPGVFLRTAYGTTSGSLDSSSSGYHTLGCSLQSEALWIRFKGTRKGKVSVS
jgi:hypothetical protein